MTYAEDIGTQSGQNSEENPSYPSAFGITFTPQISGIALGLLGVVGAVYIFMNMVMPVQEKYKQVKTDKDGKQTQLDQLNSGNLEKTLADLQGKLAQKEATKSQVMALFSNEKTFDTLLLDLNNLIASNRAKLLRYQPEPGEPIVIEDGSLGATVNGKLLRKSINLEMEGTFEETQSFLRDIERLQPLLLVKNYNSQVNGERLGVVLLNSLSNKSQGEFVPVGQPKIKTNFRLDAILPNPNPPAPPPPENGEAQASPPQGK